jgi:magnesium transporter
MDTGRTLRMTGLEPYQLFFFSELLKRRIVAGKINDRVGKVTDIVFKLAEPFPEAVGIYVEHPYGKPNEFIPWEKVVKIEADAIFIQPREDKQPYPPFVDEKHWVLVNDQLMGRTVLDMDGRRVEVVNDVHMLYSRGRMLIVHVDTSFNGFLRKLGLRRVSWVRDNLISWRYIQPLSLENVGATDSVTLSVTRGQLADLPGEDLADALEALTGEEQQAMFSALDSEKAAEVLLEAEPRAQRQLLTNLRRERARTILSEMSVPQLADLFSVLPHDNMTSLMKLLSKEEAALIQAMLSDRESTASAMMSADYVAVAREMTVGELLTKIRAEKREPEVISYIYIVLPDNVLLGIVDLRELVLTDAGKPLSELMVSPVVTAEQDDTRDDLADIFSKYQFRMIPVVDPHDHLMGVVHYKDIMKGVVMRART